MVISVVSSIFLTIIAYNAKHSDVPLILFLWDNWVKGYEQFLFECILPDHLSKTYLSLHRPLSTKLLILHFYKSQISWILHLHL